MELLTFDEIDARPAVERGDYSGISRILGQGLPNQAGFYVLPYLQTGHMLLLVTVLLATLISYPGFPLTEVPDEYRLLLFEGMVLTFLVNAATAFYSRGLAESKGQPVVFWFVKCFLLGGLALGELAQAVPDEAAKPKYPNQRK